MSEDKPRYDGGRPSRASGRLERMWRDLEDMRGALLNDVLHDEVFADLGAAQAALQRSGKIADGRMTGRKGNMHAGKGGSTP